MLVSYGVMTEQLDLLAVDNGADVRGVELD